MEFNKENKIAVLRAARVLIENRVQTYVCVAIQEAAYRRNKELECPYGGGYDIQDHLEYMVKEYIGGDYTVEDHLFKDKYEERILQYHTDKMAPEDRDECYRFRLEMIDKIIAHIEVHG